MIETETIRAGIKTIRFRAHLTLTFRNAYQKLASIALEKRNWKLRDEYGNWALAYDMEASAYNECLKTLGENPEETDEIAETIFNLEMARL